MNASAFAAQVLTGLSESFIVATPANLRGTADARSGLMVLSIWTTPIFVGTIDNMRATLIINEKSVDAEGGILQIVIWKVPRPVPPTTHGFKYRLVYACGGRRVVGFDNERGKGDHMHQETLEFPYEFRGVAQLLEDFVAGVTKWRGRT
ncbi:toxin-antitoxin system TumE family protein [Achromobacter xylosoxidans]|uniref:toxin-antitoxin system TumE family protein n=1 Tax=Alcaligenes xylosoxydans xylosoxydans TaxID=85698 RepID=UPI001F140BA1